MVKYIPSDSAIYSYFIKTKKGIIGTARYFAISRHCAGAAINRYRKKYNVRV